MTVESKTISLGRKLKFILTGLDQTMQWVRGISDLAGVGETGAQWSIV